MIALAVAIAAVVLGAILSVGMIKNKKVVAGMEITKAGLSEARIALEDGKITKEEWLEILQASLDQAKQNL